MNIGFMKFENVFLSGVAQSVVIGTMYADLTKACCGLQSL